MSKFLPQGSSHFGEMRQFTRGNGEQSGDYYYDPARKTEGANSAGGEGKRGNDRTPATWERIQRGKK